ncbi:MAG: hypothetical protein LQ352_007820 [Teloschistes flavicans]|nr:MAG: hypothetical protein LQ352_007820 [Teloschistes flavicans]
MATLPPGEIEYQLAHIHDDRSRELYASQSTCLALACIAVALRFVSRRLIHAKIMADDYMILFALVLATGFLGVGLTGRLPQGLIPSILVLANMPSSLEIPPSTSNIIYLVNIAAVKFSILLLYRRIFGIDRAFSVLSWCLAGLIFAYSLGGIFVVIFQCNPVHGFWDLMVPHTCIDFGTPATVTAVLNVITDFLTLALPMPLIWQLQMPFTRKLQLAGVFLLGAFVCIGSIYRAKIVHRISARDATWSDIDPALWASIEICIGIVSACLPTLRPVLNVLLHRNPRSEAERRFSDESDNLQGKHKRKIQKRSYLDSLGLTRLTASGTGHVDMVSTTSILADRETGTLREGCKRVGEDVV